MKKLNVGIIGCGSIAKHRHLPEYNANPAVHIAAVCDINEERAMEMATKYQATPFKDYQSLISNSDIEAVSVCTPNYLHAPIAIAALQSGKHVLCEKPIATSEEDALRMIEAARHSGKKLMIGHNQRFVKSHTLGKEIIESGKLGAIHSFRTTFGHGGPESWSADGENSWFFSKEKAHLGSLGDLGIHKADLIRFLLNEEITEAAAFVETIAKTNCTVDDNAVCIVKTESGIIGTLSSSWSYTGAEDNSTILYGENATMRLEDDPQDSLIIQYKNGDTERHQLGGIQTNEGNGQHSSGVIDRFVTSVLEDTAVPVSAEEGMKSLQVILAALRANEQKSYTVLNKEGITRI
ncbi:Gfo/Idh/MocA family protein [Bacillus sp. 1P06AnD]|uniref:Gfo/Idh/MocA family protein n=1 Tax=Bacillus sp. 1P06AnD TaxID=3132208 RepID=UPI0039A1EE68